MAGHTPWHEIRAERDEEEGMAEARAKALAELRAELERDLQSIGLAELRDRIRLLTQVTVAERLGMKQPHVSRIENQDDLLISTLRRYVDALGGRLELVAAFDDVRIPIAIGEDDQAE